jgi:hypothetical protein
MERGRWNAAAESAYRTKASSGQLAGDDRFSGRTSSLPRTPSPRSRAAFAAATIHELELVFGSDGKLRGYHFMPRAGLVEVPTGG